MSDLVDLSLSALCIVLSIFIGDLIFHPEKYAECSAKVTLENTENP